jgi:spermidine/putrescine transport system permease protein
VTAGRVLAPIYLALAYLFIFLPVLVLVLFSFQGSTLPVPPFTGPSLRWYEAVLGDRRLLGALASSLLVGVVSSLVATLLGFLAAYVLGPGESWCSSDP